MSDESEEQTSNDVGPGFMGASNRSLSEGLRTYTIGLALAALLTAAAFYLTRAHVIWAEGIFVALLVLGAAQIGVHLVFFLHLTTAPDNTNNALALAWGVLIVGILIWGSLWVLYHLNSNMVPGHRMPRADIAQLEASSALRINGTVDPVATAQFRAPVSGTLQSVQCNVGMPVQAGQLCAKIDPQPFRKAVDLDADELRRAESRLQRYSERLNEAESALARQEAFNPRNRAARDLRRSVANGQAAVSRVQAQVASRRKALAAAKAELRETEIVSPIDGIIAARNAEPGERISADVDKPLFVIVPQKVTVRTTISKQESDQVQIGDEAAFEAAALPGKRFSGEVTEIKTLLEGGATIVISIPNQTQALKGGMMGAVEISGE